MEVKINTNRGKWFDVKKTRAVFGSMQMAAEDYGRKSDATGVAYKDFENSESFRGKAADATKNFIGKGMASMNILIADKHKECIQNQKDILDGFRTMVDAAPNAYIDYDVLEKINADFCGYAEMFRTIDQTVAIILSALNSEFGEEYGTFPESDSGSVKAVFADFCGADGNMGFVKKCQKKFVDFDSELTEHIRQNDTAAFANDINNKTAKAASALNAPITPQINTSPNGMVLLNGFPKFAVNAPKDKKTEVEAFYSLYDADGNYGANHEDTGVSRWGLPWMRFDGDGNIYDFLEGKRNWNRIYNAFDNREEKNNVFGDVITDKQEMAIFKMLKGTTSADAAATNVIYDQLKWLNDEEYAEITGVQKQDVSVPYLRLLQAAFREANFDRTSLYDQGALEKLILDKCFYYKTHLDEFEKLHKGQRLLNNDGSYAVGAKELIRQDIIKGINNNELLTSLVGDNSINKPTVNNPNTIYSDVNNNEMSVVSTINMLSYFCSLKNLDMNVKCLNDYPRPVGTDAIRSELNANNSVIAEFENFELRPYSENVAGEPEKIEGKGQVTITGATENAYIVSFKGEKWLLDPYNNSSDMKIGDCYSINITKKTGTDKLQPGVNPFYGIYDKLQVDEDGYIHNDQFIRLALYTQNKLGYQTWKFKEGDKDPNSARIFRALDDMANRGSRDFNRTDMLADKFNAMPTPHNGGYNDYMYDGNGMISKDMLAWDYYMEYNDKMVIDYSKTEDKKILTDYYYYYYSDHMDQYKQKFNIADGTEIKFDDVLANCKNMVEEQAKEYHSKGTDVVKHTLTEENKKYFNETAGMENAKFALYCKEHGYNARVKSLKGKTTAERMQSVNQSDTKAVRDAMTFDGIPTNDEIKQSLTSGYNVFFRCEDMSYLEDENGHQVKTLGLAELRSKELKIQEIVAVKDPKGNVIKEKYRVLCNGKEFFYDPTKHTKDCGDYSAIKMA